MGDDLPEQMLQRMNAYITKFNRRLKSLLAKQKVALVSVAVLGTWGGISRGWRRTE